MVVHSGAADVKEKHLPPKQRVVNLRLSQVNRILGTSLSAKAVASLLGKIGFVAKSAQSAKHPVLKIAVPSWRPDCESEIDLVEEVARHFGYEKLGKLVPQSTMHGRLSVLQLRRRELRDLICSLGLSEAMPNPFLAPGDLTRAGVTESNAIRLANPLVFEESVLRTSLRPGLLKAIKYNLSHRAEDIALFEIGHVYPSGEQNPTRELPDEYESVCLVAVGESSRAALDWWSQILAVMNFGAQLDQSSVEPGFHPA
ncbi:MAG: hypothetical protein ACKOEH_00220, partial [Actinomycetota bacterium]